MMLAGRLNAVANSNIASATEPASFVASTAYNARGQTTAITYGNGMIASYGYNDARGFLTSVGVSQPALGGTILGFTYSRNAKGMITAMVAGDTRRSWNYSYDGLDRLATASNLGDASLSQSFAYDDADNMIYNSALCAANPNMVYPTSGQAHPHAPNSICGTPVTYDANGNTVTYDVDGNTVTYDVDGAGPLSPRAFTYDGENRPILVTQNGNTTSMARIRCRIR
jgi:hypothetical protein